MMLSTPVRGAPSLALWPQPGGWRLDPAGPCSGHVRFRFFHGARAGMRKGQTGIGPKESVMRKSESLGGSLCLCVFVVKEFLPPGHKEAQRSTFSNPQKLCTLCV